MPGYLPQMPSGFPWGKRGTFSWLVECKKEPLPQKRRRKKKKRNPLGNGAIVDWNHWARFFGAVPPLPIDRCRCKKSQRLEADRSSREVWEAAVRQGSLGVSCHGNFLKANLPRSSSKRG